MENIASLWSYQEIIDDFKQKLLYTTLELESVRAKANEEMKMYKEYEQQSLQLLKMAVQERDEAREQLHKLLNKLMLPSTITIPSAELLTNLPQLSPKSTLMNPIKTANSGISESNSLFEPYPYHSQNSSPVESFFDAVSSPELSNINNHIGDSSNKMGFVNQPFVQDYNGIDATSLVSTGVSKIDQGSLIIDNLVKGKTLPEKGKLLQSVLEAGPLIQTLLVAGPLPRWRNPPPLQAFHIPPVSVKDSDLENVTQKSNVNSLSYVEMSCGSSQMMSNSMLNFGNGDLGSCVGNGRLMIAQRANGKNVVPNSKRQKFH